MNEPHHFDHKSSHAIAVYEEAVKRLSLKIEEEAILKALGARDRLAQELQGDHDWSSLAHVARVDDLLRSHSSAVADTISSEKFRSWRDAVGAGPAAWWWRLDELAVARESPLWGLAGGAAIALSLSLLGVICNRFWSVGPDLASVLLLVSQVALAVITGTSFTEFGRDRISSLLQNCGIKKSHHSRYKLVLILVLLVVITAFRLCLPCIATLYNASGISNQRKGMLADAIENYQRALSLNPALFQAQYNLGTAYEDIGDYEKALTAYHTAVRGENSFYPALNNMGRIYIAYKKDYRSAVNVLTSAESLGPKEADARYTIYKNLGWAEYELKLYDQAGSDLRAAIKERETGAEAHCLLAQVYEVRSRLPEALTEWNSCAADAASDRSVDQVWRVTASERLSQGKPKQ